MVSYYEMATKPFSDITIIFQTLHLKTSSKSVIPAKQDGHSLIDSAEISQNELLRKSLKENER